MYIRTADIGYLVGIATGAGFTLIAVMAGILVAALLEKRAGKKRGTPQVVNNLVAEN